MSKRYRIKISNQFPILNSNLFRLEQFKAVGETETKKPTSTRKTPTLKYNAKKTNTDQEHRAKTIDIVRLKAGKYCITTCPLLFSHLFNYT